MISLHHYKFLLFFRLLKSEFSTILFIINLLCLLYRPYHLQYAPCLIWDT